MYDDPLIGRQLANFRVERAIRRGGMARVYYGQDVKLHRPVAIKVIDATYRGNPDYAKRFVREAQSVARWRHENIVQIYYADDENDLYYYAMEYVDGLDLSQILASYGRDGEFMPHHEVLRIGRAVAEALDFAHEKGVIHRDVKPSNIMVSSTGRVLLMDFGLALTVDDGSMGQIFGTPHYISPEQARRSDAVVPQSDLYSLGVILYEMLTGAVPFDDPAPATLALQHIREEPPRPRELNPRLNEETQAVLLKALGKEPAERYQTGEELMAALTEALAAPPPPMEEILELPPLPAGVRSRPISTLSKVSRLSLVERIALEVGDTYTDPRRPDASEPSRWRKLSVAAFGFGVLLFVLLLAAPRVTGMFVVAPTATSTPAATVAAVASPTEAVLAGIPGSATPTPAPPTMTATATASPTNTPTPTDTPTPQPTNTPTSTPTPPVRRVQLFYDGISFYLWNPSSRPLDPNPLAFAAIDSDGNTTRFSFLGRGWVSIHPRVEPQACNGLEISGADFQYFPPPECTVFNALLRPLPASESIFWVQRENVSEFHVYWNGEVMQTCSIAAGRCVVFVPES